MKKSISSLALMGCLTVVANSAYADCASLPTHAQLAVALSGARNQANGGFNLDMWGTIVDRDGVVCAIAKTGAAGDQWPGSRVISAQKANTANAFSLPGLALSTANLYTAVQPGGSLFGLQESNPVDINVAYVGSAATWGTAADDLVTEKIGGVNVFGGGLALYDDNGNLLGAIGVSGDSSCADHNIAWRTRHALVLDNVPGGVNPTNADDNIVYDIVPTNPGKSGFESTASTSGWGHPACSAAATAIAEGFPKAGSGNPL
ncbi:MAG: heme-binding protein [Thiotrichaceae bacterium]|nr:heme-binding protein [Thiotrichaceae bacterium]